ncbi:MAG: hypothetical protein M1837_002553 [Sclerophora amabilis]|nr:MAG: hypothetical protein M1837_002553 [Sclerophora amabilis]
MFRNPRENASADLKPPSKPSTGRPPTPPDTPRSEHKPPAKRPKDMAGNKTAMEPRSSSSLNGGGSGPKPVPLSNGKAKAKPNGSILTFFKKVDTPATACITGLDDDLHDPQSLFVGREDLHSSQLGRDRSSSPNDSLRSLDVLGRGRLPEAADVEDLRYNEDTSSAKRRKLDRPGTFPPGNGGEALSSIAQSPGNKNDSVPGGGFDLDQIRVGQIDKGNPELPPDEACSPPPPDLGIQKNGNEGSRSSKSLKGGSGMGQSSGDIPPSKPSRSALHGRSRGPFVEDSESDDENTSRPVTNSDVNDHTLPNGAANSDTTFKCKTDLATSVKAVRDGIEVSKASGPGLKRDSTNSSNTYDFEDFEDFEDDDEYADGEEFLERRYMEEEQRMLEIAENGLEEDYINDKSESHEIKKELEPDPTHITSDEANGEAAVCPVCNASLKGIQDNKQAQVHVNNCLDGNPTPLPRTEVKQDAEIKGVMTPGRFQRPARPAKPAQANPFATASNGSSSSAFSRLMSSHAEDEAWATAAAAENSARGKPAYQRTCPFYKILPGFSICVDAFRYGAVEGCQAYFLSHFHSDHYVGLTSSWQHGPIYCSRVTANLVRQQLRVDPKYVVDLDFERKIQVPDTNGVEVTMIPANHCPGSSLYLFEKAVGKGKNPRLQRVLHCGDFRACPAHLRHPLLRPDLIDPVTSKQNGQQRIDVCYLDTTYLNPRYAFPSQENVIKACADMCVSLRKERPDENDDWETMKRERAGSGMAKFVRKDSSSLDQAENDDDNVNGMKTEEHSGKTRGRLLVVVGTYSIGKERICVGIAKALQSKIFAPAGKQRICACLEDPQLDALLTKNPAEAQVHMTPLFEIRAETLQDYLNAHKPHFSRVVGFRPSGWTYRPPNSRFVESPQVQTVLHSNSWRTAYTMAELVPQRGSSREASCFGVPYSEHSSFRELTMFCCALRIDKVIPTVNVGSAKIREKMKAWIEKWALDRKKNGLFKLPDGQDSW